MSTEPAQLTTKLAMVVRRPMEIEVSGDVREFMHRPPHWLLRSGTTVLAAFMALLLVLSLVIKYPDTITGRITVIGTQPVMEVIGRQDGRRGADCHRRYSPSRAHSYEIRRAFTDTSA